MYINNSDKGDDNALIEWVKLQGKIEAYSICVVIYQNIKKKKGEEVRSVRNTSYKNENERINLYVD